MTFCQDFSGAFSGFNHLCIPYTVYKILLDVTNKSAIIFLQKYAKFTNFSPKVAVQDAYDDTTVASEAST